MIDEGNITGTQFIIIALVSIVIIAIIWHRMGDWEIPEPKHHYRLISSATGLIYRHGANVKIREG